MHLPTDAEIPDSQAQRQADKRRWLRAFNLSLAFIGVLTAVFLAQPGFDVGRWTVNPGEWSGLLGVLTAPLLHGSFEHLAANAIALLMLGTLAGGMYPKATARALPLIWIGSGLGAWLLGHPGSHHLGASGLTHGLMFMVFLLGLLRRDRPAVAASMAAFLFYGGMLLTVLPREPGVSWQAHLGGALGGVVAAWLFSRLDPQPPRKRYSWEDEEELDATAEADRNELEPQSPRDVPVIWQRRDDEETGTVLPFRRRDH
ncbi:rhomboid family intramembrane serine protease [Marilutibacter maris]|uniref:Membrane protein n=1 Tax=Marilutibacter maris TaxID=1605891 RepID=A0A2U9T350_9GAMM|nr:rhomboid family intramembrane serine protease [Lysobacter maris]AWV05785.1 membrane protein [Lysobacter maris]KAB8197011.1 rhomboid family intramembrane serine protease [Lysobacter maris]